MAVAEIIVFFIHTSRLFRSCVYTYMRFKTQRAAETRICAMSSDLARQHLNGTDGFCEQVRNGDGYLVTLTGLPTLAGPTSF
jgi:hypothetical protein